MIQMISEAFKDAYKKLNLEQKRAVDTIEGPVMVIAGPGTGKTSVLTLRIGNILKETDTPPDGILALTFTESAVASMRRKLVSLIGPSAYRVGLYTFHGFAEEIIRRYPESFPRIIGGDVATEAEKLSIVEEIIDKNSFQLIKPFGSPHHYVRSALGTISDLKRDAYSPDDFSEILDKEEKNILGKEGLKHIKGRYKGELKSEYKDALKNIEKNRELEKLYRAYEEALMNRRLYDFDDMLLELIRAFEKNPDLLQSIQEEFLYFLADEHQDANNAQNQILELLASFHPDPNLFIVGDEKQAIYRFQGASLDNFLYFKNKFKKAKLIFLDANYRSHQNILDASHALAENLPGDKAMRPKLLSKGESLRGEIELVNYPSELDELVGLSNLIKKEIENKTKPEDIAILVRTNKEIPEVGRAISALGIPTTLFQDDDVLSDPDIGRLILLLRAVVDPSDKELVAEMLFIDFLGLDPIRAIELLNKSHEERLSEIEKFKDWVSLAKNRSALETFTKILAESGFTEYLLTLPDSIEKMSLLSALYEEITSRQAHKKDLTLVAFLKDIETLKEHGVRLTFTSRLKKAQSVSVMTAHKSKGMEWKVVFIPHVFEGNWGSKRSMSNFKLPYPLGSAQHSGQEEDERRLFYVTLTRAKDKLVITHSSLGTDGKERIPSQFVEELPKEFVISRLGESADQGEALLKKVLSASSRERTIWDREYLIEKFREQGLNVTALNNYLYCPWKYFWRNLIRIPSALEKHQIYGNAMHGTLSFMTNALRESQSIKLEEAVAIFERSLARAPLDQEEFDESLKKGKKSLGALWKEDLKGWHKNALSEFNISGVHLALDDGTYLLLRGRLDKVDLLDDSHVRVIDFKTGKAESRNAILGETKNSTGDKKRQLDFYKLLLDLYDDGRYEMNEGAIFFTEPDEKGRLKKEVFDITRADGEKVADEIRRVAREVLDLSFWDQTCGKKDCESCSLRRVLIK